MADKKHKILIIDDDPVQVESLAMILEHLYEIESLNSGKDALDKVKTYKPDLILLDINMPDIEGFEVCRSFKEDEELRDIPIIFCSARLRLEDKVNGFKSGGVDYITKPFEMEEVLARLETHLKLKDALKTINEYNQTLEERIDRQTRELIKAERHCAFSITVKGIVHNLKNPLAVASINLNTNIAKMRALKGLLRETNCDEEIYDYIDDMLEFIKLSANSCNKMNDSLTMLMTKSYAEKKDKITAIDLNELLSNEIKFLSTDLTYRDKIKKNINLSNQILTAKIVPAEIIQVFQNLIKNAMDAVAGAENPEITVSSGQNDDVVWFSVMDNGSGIPEDKLPNIFDPFFSTKTEKEDKSSGLGLGLYFCNEIINSYGGTIKVESKEGEGTCFTIEVPFLDRNV